MHNKQEAAKNQNAVVSMPMEGIMPESRRKMSIGLADLERAQKFRERAKSTTVGKPEFRVSNKREGKYKDDNIYKTLGSHPDLLELKAQNSGGQLYNGPRRISDDRTSNCNSVNDEESGIVNITNTYPQGESETFVSRDSHDNNQHYLLSNVDSIATMEQPV